MSLILKLKKIPAFIFALFSLLRPRAWGPFLEAYSITRFDHAFSISWSQGGEDTALLQLLDTNRNGAYIDVGCHHPSRFSVTRHLYQRGWRGVNIDANPEVGEFFKRERPDELFIHACVGNSSSYLFTIFEERALSTSDLVWKNRYINEHQKVFKEVQVPGISLFKIITENFKTSPDLLIVDAEGSDFDVISSCKWDCLPRNLWPLWILCETTPPISEVIDSNHVNLLIDLGYEIICSLPMSTILKLKSVES
jgi:FkbM family methyltransferase